MTDTVRCEVDGHVAVVSLDRPGKLNAVDATMFDELLDVYERLDADSDVRAVVVTGEGRAFCAGADLSAGPAAFDSGGEDGWRDGGGILALRVFSLRKPIIAAVNGAAVGMGATMTLPMDIRLASTTARFGFVFTRRGIVPEGCSSWFLPRLVGISTAMEWCGTGRFVDAEAARAAGLVRSVHPPDELLDAAVALAREVAASAPVSVALTRAMLWRMLGEPHPMTAHRVESALLPATGAMPDAREGVAAFLDKRAASFTGRVPDDLPASFPWWEDPAF